MHALLGSSSILLAVLAGYLVLRWIRRVRTWPLRRDLQFGVLAAPVVGLAAAIFGLHHSLGRTCWLARPPWDDALGLALPVAIGGVALAGLLLGTLRLAVMYIVVVRQGVPAGPAMQTVADGLAERLGAPRPRVYLYSADYPLAITYGVWRPTVLLSTWMVEHLDRGELESVLAHEVAHVVRRDYLMIWLATALRDGFFYLPTSRAAYRQLVLEKELACDDLTRSLTRRPLALASALAKVWGYGPRGTFFWQQGAQALRQTHHLIEGRIGRLLASPPQEVPRPSRHPFAIGVGLVGLIGLLAVEAATAIVLFFPMGCAPGFPSA